MAMDTNACARMHACALLRIMIMIKAIASDRDRLLTRAPSRSPTRIRVMQLQTESCLQILRVAVDSSRADSSPRELDRLETIFIMTSTSVDSDSRSDCVEDRSRRRPARDLEARALD